MSDDGKAGDSVARGYGGFKLSVIKFGLFMAWATFVLLLSFLNAALKWWMVLILALPLSFLTEWVGGKVFAGRYGWSTEQVGFSPKRIVIGVLLILGVSAVVYLVSGLFN